MNEGFKDWLMGISIFFIAAIVLYVIGNTINPINSFSLLEWWGIIMLTVILRSGYLTYHDDDYE